MSGKTKWVKRLLKRKEDMMSPIPKKVIFCYKYWQPSHTKMLIKMMSDITVRQGIRNDLVQTKYFDPSVTSFIAVNDFMRTVMNDDMVADLFTEGAHHRNISVVVIIRKLSFSWQAS